MAIEFSLAAEDDLLGIFLYGIQEHGLAQAERYKGQLEATFQTISDNPKITRLRREITPPVCGGRSRHPCACIPRKDT